MIRLALVLGVVAVVLVAPAAAAAPKVVGFVDGSEFIDLAGDDAVSVEISLQGALLKILTGVDEDLSRLAGGLESIHAVVLELEDDRTKQRLAQIAGETEKRLLGRGWDRLARVREADAEVKILVLNDEEAIQGLVVIVLEHEEAEFVFVNIAGTLDLSALAQLGERMDLPGLDQIPRDDDE